MAERNVVKKRHCHTCKLEIEGTAKDVAKHAIENHKGVTK